MGFIPVELHGSIHHPQAMIFGGFQGRRGRGSGIRLLFSHDRRSFFKNAYTPALQPGGCSPDGAWPDSSSGEFRLTMDVGLQQLVPSDKGINEDQGHQDHQNEYRLNGSFCGQTVFFFHVKYGRRRGERQYCSRRDSAVIKYGVTAEK
jgi:hypothetical protein